MLKTHWKLVSRLERVGDNLLILAAFFLTYNFRDNIASYGDLLGNAALTNFKELGRIEDYFIVLGCAIPGYNALLSLLGGYRSMRFSTPWKLLRVALVAHDDHRRRRREEGDRGPCEADSHADR